MIFFNLAMLKNDVNFSVSCKEFIQSGEKVVVKYIQYVVVFIDIYTVKEYNKRLCN
jgi:hypothetical protein